MDTECFLEELLLFLEVDGLQATGDGSTGSATGVQNMAAVVVLGGIEQGFDTRLGVAPCASVQGLLLGPHDVLGIRVAVEVLLQLGPWEGVQLLNAGDGGVADTVRLAVFREGSVHLARAEDHTLNLLGLVDRRAVTRIRDDPLEVRIAGELLDRRAGNRVTQERLGEEDDKR